jgi:hypothetical protein
VGVSELSCFPLPYRINPPPPVCRGQSRHRGKFARQNLPLKDAAEAHKLMESSKHIGKIILTVTG